MKSIKREIEDIERFEEILEMLLKQGFGFLLDEINVLQHLPLPSRIAHSNRKPAPERLRETFEELGPTFIKFGQIMAERPDIIPEEYIEELEKLQDDVPPFDQEKAKEIVDEEIGLESFIEFEDKPLASASIAQVHRARLKSGEDVVVKIRRPGIKDQMRKDLDVLKYLAKKADRHFSKFRGLAYADMKEFARWTQEELDLEQEGRNAITLKDNLSDEERIKIPEIYMDYTTEKVLVMEYLEGVKANDGEALEKMNVDAEKIATTGVKAAIKQIIRDGFFHADPHPSNFRVDSDGNLIFLDFGMMGRFSKRMRKDIGLLILHTYNEDIESLAQDLVRMGNVRDPDMEQLENDLERIVLDFKNTTIEENSISRSLIRMTEAAADNGVYLPSSMMLVGKGILTMEGIGLSIYPEFRPDDELTRFTEKILIESFGPKETAENAAIDLIENQDLLTKLPSKLNQLTEKKQTEIEISQETVSTRAIIAGALILSSSVMLMQGPESQLFMIGIIELVVAALTIWHS